MGKQDKAIGLAAIGDAPMTRLDGIRQKTSINLNDISTISTCVIGLINRLDGERLTEGDTDDGPARCGVLGSIEDMVDDQSYIIGKLRADIRFLEQLL